MLKREAFLEVIQAGVSDNAVEMALTEKGIDPAATFVEGGLAELELAAIPVLQSLLTVSSESEGSRSESRSREGIKDRLLFLARKHGQDDIVTDVLRIPKVSAYKWR